MQEIGEGALAGLDTGLQPTLSLTAGSDAVRDYAWLVGVLPLPPARLLDAGCGDGAVAGWLTGLGYRVTAIDADPDAVASARAARVPAIQADLAGYPDQPFDAVLMLLTLHHIRVPLVDVLGKMSAQVIRSDDPASVPVALAAGALLAAAAASTARALWRRAAALAAAGRQARRLPGSGQVVVTADDAADAYTLPGLPCRVVVTAGMLHALSHPEQQVLLAHERARAALAATASPPRRLPGPGVLGVLGTGTRLTRGPHPGPVPRRVAALLRPPPQPSLLLLAAGLLLVAVSGASVLEAARDLHAVLALARDAGPS